MDRPLPGDAAKPDPASWEYPDTWLDGDHQLSVGTRTLDAVSTPGHTQGHFVFADRAAGLLFAGDHVLPTDHPVDRLRAGVRRAAARRLPVIPGQGAGDAGPAAAAGARRGDRLDARAGSTSSWPTTTSGSGSASSRSSAVAGRRTRWLPTCPGRGTRPRSEDLDDFNTALAAMETMAHLELLVAQGRATRTDADGVRVYGP